MKIRSSCLLLGVCLLAGCWQKSLHPFYTAADLESDGKLIGSWREDKEVKPGEKDEREVWTFSAGNEKSYKLEIASSENTRTYQAHLFKFAGQRLLDVTPIERTYSSIPAHNLFKVTSLTSNLELAALNPEWVQQWLRKNPGALPYMAVPDHDNPNDREKDELVLTADTKALQKFLRQHSGEEEFFTKPTVFKPVGGARR